MEKKRSGGARRRMGKLERKNTLVAYSFLAPNFLGFAIFTLVPVVCAILLSLYEWNGGDIAKLKFVGLENYATIFNTAKVAEKGLGYFFNRVDLGISLKNTVFYTLVTVPLTLVCALALAMLLNKIKGAVFFRVLLYSFECAKHSKEYLVTIAEWFHLFPYRTQ